MPQKLVFVNRRRGVDRRFSKNPHKNTPTDLDPSSRRKSTERRDTSRSLTDDYYAYMHKSIESAQTRFKAKRPAKSPKN